MSSNSRKQRNRRRAKKQKREERAVAEEAARAKNFEMVEVEVDDEAGRFVYCTDEYVGQDGLGNVFTSVDELWKMKFQAAEKKFSGEDIESKDQNPRAFYKHGANYWMNIDANDNGMLGGYAHISPTDVKGSKAFLESLNIPMKSAVDCGAGIGRVSKHLLCPLFKKVDLVEQNPDFVEKAKLNVKHPSMSNFYAVGLQDFKPASGTYDCVWIQWVIGQLPDDDLVSFLKCCRDGLTDNGVICIKDNCTRGGFLYDDDDGSIMRSEEMFLKAFADSGLKPVRNELQKGFPQELMDVRMFALRPSAV